MAETLAELLDQAADVVVERGFHQGWFCANDDGSGPVCIRGALSVAATGSALPQGWTKLLDEAISLLDEACDATLIERWNDTTGRTADEVVELLRATAREVSDG